MANVNETTREVLNRIYEQACKTATGAIVCPMRVGVYEAREDAEFYGLRYVVEFKSGYKAMRKPSNIGTVVMDLKASK